VNAYAAGLKVTAHGELVGVVSQEGIDSPVPYPLLSAKPLDPPEQNLETGGKSDGSYTFALRPGRYDLSVSAFGFLSDTIHNIAIYTETQTSLDITLASAPGGSLSGQITDLNSGLPLSATLLVEGTPVQALADPATGIYHLSLPEGSREHKIISRPIASYHPLTWVKRDMECQPFACSEDIISRWRPVVQRQPDCFLQRCAGCP
jgi:hypothetical protein